MSKRQNNMRGYERWMKMAAAVGAAAFGVPLEPTKKRGDPVEALWEHEEIFTDDDEAVAVGNDPEEREDILISEISAPPEIKQNQVIDPAEILVLLEISKEKERDIELKEVILVESNETNAVSPTLPPLHPSFQ